ncbi:MAG: glycosyltransferase, partial [Planctomycetota bacterium]
SLVFPALERPLLSVIVCTHERPRCHALVLAALREQRGEPGPGAAPLPPFEVIVADDGSGAAIAEVVRRFETGGRFSLQHVRQSDRGFRAAAARNLGARAARGEYLVFLDADCVPLPGFLAAHLSSARPDRVLAGDRLFLGETVTREVTADEAEEGRIARRLSRRQLAALRLRALKNRLYGWTGLKERPKLVTANLSLHRKSLEAVNGLDERYQGWGLEDEDLRRRLVRRGYRIHPVTTGARVVHLWHPLVGTAGNRIRHGANASYHQRQTWLACCRHGLVNRSIEACRIAWNGRGAVNGDGVEISIGWGADPQWRQAEVRVLLQHGSQWPPHPGRCADLVLVGEGSRVADSLSRESEIPAIPIPGGPDPRSEEGRRAILGALEPVVG